MDYQEILLSLIRQMANAGLDIEQITDELGMELTSLDLNDGVDIDNHKYSLADLGLIENSLNLSPDEVTNLADLYEIYDYELKLEAYQNDTVFKNYFDATLSFDQYIQTVIPNQPGMTHDEVMNDIRNHGYDLNYMRETYNIDINDPEITTLNGDYLDSQNTFTQRTEELLDARDKAVQRYTPGLGGNNFTTTINNNRGGFWPGLVAGAALGATGVAAYNALSSDKKLLESKVTQTLENVGVQTQPDQVDSATMAADNPNNSAQTTYSVDGNDNSRNVENVGVQTQPDQVDSATMAADNPNNSVDGNDNPNNYVDGNDNPRNVENTYDEVSGDISSGNVSRSTSFGSVDSLESERLMQDLVKSLANLRDPENGAQLYNMNEVVNPIGESINSEGLDPNSPLLSSDLQANRSFNNSDSMENGAQGLGVNRVGNQLSDRVISDELDPNSPLLSSDIQANRSFNNSDSMENGAQGLGVNRVGNQLSDRVISDELDPNSPLLSSDIQANRSFNNLDSMENGAQGLGVNRVGNQLGDRGISDELDPNSPLLSSDIQANRSFNNSRDLENNSLVADLNDTGELVNTQIIREQLTNASIAKSVDINNSYNLQDNVASISSDIVKEAELVNLNEQVQRRRPNLENNNSNIETELNPRGVIRHVSVESDDQRHSILSQGKFNQLDVPTPVDNFKPIADRASQISQRYKNGEIQINENNINKDVNNNDLAKLLREKIKNMNSMSNALHTRNERSPNVNEINTLNNNPKLK